MAAGLQALAVRRRCHPLAALAAVKDLLAAALGEPVWEEPRLLLHRAEEEEHPVRRQEEAALLRREAIPRTGLVVLEERRGQLRVNQLASAEPEAGPSSASDRAS